VSGSGIFCLFDPFYDKKFHWQFFIGIWTCDSAGELVEIAGWFDGTVVC
jgi:hypothetical protein